MSEVLHGNIVRLEPLQESHAEGLVRASMFDDGLYKWSPVPQGIDEVRKYIQTALEWKEAGTAQPYAIVRVHGNNVIGSTRFFQIEKWAWKPDHPRHGRAYPDAAEIGYTWLDNSAIRTGVNTEAKFLLLQHAFEKWQAYRICLHTDVRNDRSKAAIERIGGKFEGVLRSHRLANDATPRDSARFSILLSEWPEVKQRLHKLLRRE
ncbi:MAG TPA: GNAT family protein [Puia sp.]|nr:GNAT family protein [Puia sp.]